MMINLIALWVLLWRVLWSLLLVSSNYRWLKLLVVENFEIWRNLYRGMPKSRIPGKALSSALVLTIEPQPHLPCSGSIILFKKIPTYTDLDEKEVSDQDVGKILIGWYEKMFSFLWYFKRAKLPGVFLRMRHTWAVTITFYEYNKDSLYKVCSKWAGLRPPLNKKREKIGIK